MAALQSPSPAAQDQQNDSAQAVEEDKEDSTQVEEVVEEEKIVYDEEVAADEDLSQEHTWRKWKVKVMNQVKAAAKLKRTRLRELLSTLLTIDKMLDEHKEKALL